MKEEFSTIQKLINVTITSIGCIGTYTGGITLAKNNPEYHNLIFIGTVIISYISPRVLNTTTTYVIKKYNDKKKHKK